MWNTGILMIDHEEDPPLAEARPVDILIVVDLPEKLMVYCAILE